MKYFKISLPTFVLQPSSFEDSSTIILIIKISNINIADPKPNLPISLKLIKITFAIVYNFSYKGVNILLSVYKKSSILPIEEFFPTAVTTILPSPVNNLVPDNKNGESIS